MPRDFDFNRSQWLVMEQRNKSAEKSKTLANTIGQAMEAHKSGVVLSPPPQLVTPTTSEGTSEKGSSARDDNFDAPEEAADLSGSSYQTLYTGKRLDINLFGPLKLLILAGSRLTCQDLADVLSAAPRLERLDLSRCNLTEVPDAQHWMRMERLSQLFLHQNNLRNWRDITNPLAPPLGGSGILWFTAFSNPISAQPEYRRVVLQRNTNLLLIDYWVVTDDERLQFIVFPGEDKYRAALRREYDVRRGLECCKRFFAFGKQTEFCTTSYNERRLVLEDHRVELLGQMRHELWGLRVQSNFCSAACFLQSRWKMLLGQRILRQKRKAFERATVLIQKFVRGFMWRREMIQYTKAYLEEVDQLDLLLSANEMIKKNAMKLIRQAIVQWVHRRQMRKAERRAGMRVTRTARGYITRRRLMKMKFQLSDCPRVYVPEYFAWEFHILVNVANKQHGLPRFPRGHQFNSADVVGIRMPDTDEYTWCTSTFFTLNRIATKCMVRNKRCGRHPDVQWDGPPHAIVGQDENPRLQQSYRKVRRRAVEVNNHCRRAFLHSCAASREHPIDMMHKVDGEDAEVEKGLPEESLLLKGLIEGPEADWPEAARRPEAVLNRFMKEARLIGSRPRRGLGSRTGAAGGPQEIPGEPGLRSYRRTCWNNQKLIYHTCANQHVALDLLLLLMDFSQEVCTSLGRITSVSPFPFMCEFHVRRVAAATVIQATYRAHRERMELPFNLRTAVTMRRAAICIQRWYRWGIMKRRLEFLRGAVLSVRAVKGTSLFIEERMFAALNVLSGIDRLPPLVRERDVSLGVREKSDSDSELVLLSRGLPRRDPRVEGIPLWLHEKVGELNTLKPDDKSLKQVSGITGMLQDGNEVRPEEPLLEVFVPQIAHWAKLERVKENAPLALLASGGTFRYVELRYPTLTHARRRALALFLCTYDVRHRVSVPILTKRDTLRDVGIGMRCLHMWELYGLTWPPGDRLGPYTLRMRGAMNVVDLPINGKQSWDALPKPGQWSSHAEDLPDMPDDETEKQYSTKSRRKEKSKGAENGTFAFSAMSDLLAQRRHREELELQAAFTGGHDADAQAALSRVVNDQSSKQTLHGEGELAIPITGLVGRIPPLTDQRVLHPAEHKSSQYYETLHEIVDAERKAELERARQRRDEVRASKQQTKAIVEQFNMIKVSNARLWSANHTPTSVAEEVFEFENPEEVAFRRRLVRAHCEREKALLERSESFVRIASFAEKREERDEQEEDVLNAKAQAKIERQEQYKAAKERKQAVQQARQCVHSVRQKLASIQRSGEQNDIARRREEREQALGARLEYNQYKGDRRAAFMAEKHSICLQQRRAQVDQLKTELQAHRAEKLRKEQEEILEHRAKILEQKQWDGLLRSMRGQLDKPENTDSCKPAVDAGVALEHGSPEGGNTMSTTATAEELWQGWRKLPSQALEDWKRVGGTPPEKDTSPKMSKWQAADEDIVPALPTSRGETHNIDQEPMRWHIVEEPLPLKPPYPPGQSAPFPRCHKPRPPPPLPAGALLVKPPTAPGSRRARSARGVGDRWGAVLPANLSPAAAKAAEPWLAKFGGGPSPAEGLPVPLSAR